MFRLAGGVNGELKPSGALADLCDLFEAARRLGAYYHEGVGLLDCAGGGAFCIRVSQPMPCCWGNQDGHADGSAQHARPQVARADVDQHARAKSQLLEGGSIGTQAHLILTAALIIIPGPRDVSHPFPRERFIVKQVDRLHGSRLLHNGVHRSLLLS